MYVDKWGRKPTMWITGIAMAINFALIMGFTAKYAHSTNTVGQGFTIAFIFCFSIMFVWSWFHWSPAMVCWFTSSLSHRYSLGYNSIHYIYVPEIMNQEIRAKGSSVAVCANVLVNSQCFVLSRWPCPLWDQCSMQSSWTKYHLEHSPVSDTSTTPSSSVQIYLGR